MPNWVRTLLRSWVQGVAEVLMFYPVLLLISPLPGLEEQFPYWVAALTLYMPIGTLLRLLLRLEMRVLLLLVNGVLLIGGTWLVFGTGFAALGALIAGGVLYVHGFRIVRTPWYQLFPVGLYWICLIFYMVAGLILTRVALYDTYSSSLGWLGAVALVLTLFLSNTSNLKQETHSGTREVRLAPGVMWKNRLLIVLVLAVVMAIGYIRPLMELVVSLKNWLVGLINALFQRTKDEPDPISATPPPVQNPQMPLEGDGGPSAFARFMELLFYYVGVALVVALALVVLFFLGRLAVRGVRRLIVWLRERGALAPEGVQEYEEEKATLLDWSEMQQQLRDRLAGFVSRFQRDPKWEALSGAERVRLLYRLYIRRSVGAGAPLEPHLTAREQLSAREDRHMNDAARRELGEAYEAVRYGDRPVDGSQATRLKKDSGL
ncbi:DUF4129 domain-containing protein [Paenibacillus sp. HJGM_3]|uniref:DUF4129 domain-containing protein n=1 Tax=Paenibacillus sp. HJGM_3 TaxID=3379816 RepID=UPI00385FA53A